MLLSLNIHIRSKINDNNINYNKNTKDQFYYYCYITEHNCIAIIPQRTACHRESLSIVICKHCGEIDGYNDYCNSTIVLTVLVMYDGCIPY